MRHDGVPPQKTWRAGEVAESLETTRAYSSPNCSPTWRAGEQFGELGWVGGYPNIKCYVACVRHIDHRIKALRPSATAH
jgi:hypothetical protein